MSERASLPANTIRDAQAENTKLRARDLADQLGISEAQLVAAQVGFGTAKIDAHPDRVMAAAERLGEVMALTRTPSVVHEKVGEYANYTPGAHAAMVLNEAIDLRIFPKHWVHAFAVETAGDKGPRRSLQVFDAAGDAVHKIHLREGSDHDAWAGVVSDLSQGIDQTDSLSVAPFALPTGPEARPDRAEELRTEWDKMTDTHQFMTLTRRLKMNRLGAYRVVGEPWVRRLAPSSVEDLLNGLGDSAVPCMIFVGNQGCIQIHSGPIKKIVPMGPWINVMDPGFNLHLRGDHIAEVYEVHKPTKRGMAISVEAFDKDGAIILQIFGKRSEVNGNERAEDYAALVAGLPGDAQSAEVTA